MWYPLSKSVCVCSTSGNQVHLRIISSVAEIIRVVGPCHHGMARPQVADRGTASFMEGSCE